LEVNKYSTKQTLQSTIRFRLQSTFLVALQFIDCNQPQGDCIAILFNTLTGLHHTPNPLDGVALEQKNRIDSRKTKIIL